MCARVSTQHDERCQTRKRSRARHIAPQISQCIKSFFDGVSWAHWNVWSHSNPFNFLQNASKYYLIIQSDGKKWDDSQASRIIVTNLRHNFPGNSYEWTRYIDEDDADAHPMRWCTCIVWRRRTEICVKYTNIVEQTQLTVQTVGEKMSRVKCDAVENAWNIPRTEMLFICFTKEKEKKKYSGTIGSRCVRNAIGTLLVPVSRWQWTSSAWAFS